MKLLNSIIYTILSVQEKFLRFKLSRTIGFKNTSKRKRHFGNGFILDLNSIADAEKEKLEAEITNILKVNEYDPKKLLKYIEAQGTKVFYTAHGFHFFKGAPLKNWLIYYPVEKFCAKYTDVLITINKEDYELAQKKIHAKKVCYVPGVGIDLEKIRSVQADRNEVRKSMGVPEDCVLLLSIGELNVNKNHQVVVKVLAKLGNKNVHYAIAGVGDQKENLLNLAKELGVENQFHLLGYRTDALKLYHGADVYVFPSFREGLSVSMMEAMASGLPIVCSKIRGNEELVEDGKGGYLFSSSNEVALTDSLRKMIDNEILRENAGRNNTIAIEKFGLEKVLKDMRKIYK